MVHSTLIALLQLQSIGVIPIYSSTGTADTDKLKGITGSADQAITLDFNKLVELLKKLFSSGGITSDGNRITTKNPIVTTKGTAPTTVNAVGITIRGLGSGSDVSAVILIDFTTSSQKKWDVLYLRS
ncbi:hypothetical protein COOONC_22927 [Cooperia oncophora]